MFRHFGRWARRNPEISTPIIIGVVVVAAAIVVIAIAQTLLD